MQGCLVNLHGVFSYYSIVQVLGKVALAFQLAARTRTPSARVVNTYSVRSTALADSNHLFL